MTGRRQKRRARKLWKQARALDRAAKEQRRAVQVSDAEAAALRARADRLYHGEDFERSQGFTDPLVVENVRGEATCLRDLWVRGSSAFYVCGGPSLRELDVSRLAERGIVSLGLNNAAGYAPVTAFCHSDPSGKFHPGIWFDPCIMKFVPRPKMGYKLAVKHEGKFYLIDKTARDCPNVWAFKRCEDFVPETFFTRDGATWGNNQAAVDRGASPHFLFTFFLGFRLLHYLGVRRVFMLGVDFGGSSYAFGQRLGGCNSGSYLKARKWCDQLAPVFDEFGFEVFNCNRESGLKTFPHVAFSEALEEVRGYVPRGEFDLEGWYEKKYENDPKKKKKKNEQSERGQG